jgi:Domain of unknown function (DUF5615)
VKFVVDAQLPPALARLLRETGCDAFAVREIGLREANDGEIWRYVVQQQAARAPFETFALELANGRVIQIHERHLVATTSGTHHGEGVIGVLYENGSFELINAGQILSVSVGFIRRSKKSLQREWSRSEKDSRGRPSTTNETHPIAGEDTAGRARQSARRCQKPWRR